MLRNIPHISCHGGGRIGFFGGLFGPVTMLRDMSQMLRNLANIWKTNHKTKKTTQKAQPTNQQPGKPPKRNLPLTMAGMKLCFFSFLAFCLFGPVEMLRNTLQAKLRASDFLRNICDVCQTLSFWLGWLEIKTIYLYAPPQDPPLGCFEYMLVSKILFGCEYIYIYGTPPHGPWFYCLLGMANLQIYV